MFYRIPPQGGGRGARRRQSSSSSSDNNGERSKHHRHKRTGGGGNGDGHRRHHKHNRSPRRQSVANVRPAESRRHKARNDDKRIEGRDEEQSDSGTSRSRRESRVNASTTKTNVNDGEKPSLKKTSTRQTVLDSRAAPTKSKAEPAKQMAGHDERQAEKRTTPKRRTTALGSAPKTKTTYREPEVDSDSSSNLKTAGKAKRGEVRNATKEAKRTAASRSTATTKKKPAAIEAPKKITVVCDQDNEEYVEYVEEVRTLFSELGLPTHLCTEDGFIQINRSLQKFHSDKYLSGKTEDEQPSQIEQEAKREIFEKFKGIRDKIKAHQKNETQVLNDHQVRVRDGVLDMFEKGAEKAKLARENHENELRKNGERQEVIAKRMEEYNEGIKEKAKACISVTLRDATEKRVQELKLKEEKANTYKYPIRPSQTWSGTAPPEFNSPQQSYTFPMNGYQGASAGSAAYGNSGSIYGSEYTESTDYTEDSEDSDEYDEEDTTYKYIPQQLEDSSGTSRSMGVRAPRPGMSDWETIQRLEKEHPATAEYLKRQVMGQRGISHY